MFEYVAPNPSCHCNFCFSDKDLLISHGHLKYHGRMVAICFECALDIVYQAYENKTSPCASETTLTCDSCDNSTDSEIVGVWQKGNGKICNECVAGTLKTMLESRQNFGVIQF